MQTSKQVVSVKLSALLPPVMRQRLLLENARLLQHFRRHVLVCGQEILFGGSRFWRSQQGMSLAKCAFDLIMAFCRTNCRSYCSQIVWCLNWSNAKLESTQWLHGMSGFIREYGVKVNRYQYLRNIKSTFSVKCSFRFTWLFCDLMLTCGGWPLGFVNMHSTG
jgi:hypothetical protein